MEGHLKITPTVLSKALKKIPGSKFLKSLIAHGKVNTTGVKF